MFKINIFFLLIGVILSNLSQAVDWSSLSTQELEENYLVAQQRYSVMIEYHEFLHGKGKSLSDSEIKKNAWEIGFKLHVLEQDIKRSLNERTLKNEPIDAEKCVKIWSTPAEILRLSVNYLKDWSQMSPGSTETIYRKLQVDLLLNYINAILLHQISLNEELGKTPLSNSGIFCDFKARKEILMQMLQLQDATAKLYKSAHGTKGLRNLHDDLNVASRASVIHYERQLQLVVPKLIISAGIPLFAQLKLVNLMAESSSLIGKATYFGFNAALGGYSASSLVDWAASSSNQLLEINSMDYIKVKDLFISLDQDRFLDLIDIHREINDNLVNVLLKANFDYNKKYTFIKRGLKKFKTEDRYLDYLRQIKKEIESELKSRES